MALVGLESTFYNVSENEGVVEVCAVVYSPDISCPINFAFDVKVVKSIDSSSADGSGGDGNAGDDSANGNSASDGYVHDGYVRDGYVRDGSANRGSASGGDNIF